jgi:type IV pilus assembly protein PilM
MPDPSRQKLNFDKPEDRPAIEILRVHIDAIKPVWRPDVSTWYSTELKPPELKDTMLVYDRETPPTGPGWIVQIIGHHYNPYPKNPKNPAPFEYGPTLYLTSYVVPQLGTPRARQFGLHHPVLAWLSKDAKWTSEKGLSTNSLASTAVPLLPKAEPPAAAAGAPGMEGGGAMGSFRGDAAMMPNPGMMMGNSAAYGESMMAGMNNPMMGMYGAQKKDEKNIKYLTRTDFMIEVVWQPPDPTKPPEDLAELGKKIREAESKTKGATKTPVELEKALEDASKKASDQAVNKLNAAQGAGGTTPPGSAPAAPANGAVPAPGATPAAPGNAAPPANSGAAPAAPANPAAAPAAPPK